MVRDEPCPFKGLAAFAKGDREWFFGRTVEASLLAGATLSSSLTIFYGPSGVGKTSLLNASLPQALANADPDFNVENGVLRWGLWQPDFQEGLRGAAAKQWLGKETSEFSLSEVAQQIFHSQRPEDLLSGASQPPDEIYPRILILDQFEEYFLYHPFGDEEFEKAISTLINRGDHDFHLIIAMRDDGLHLLDRLRYRIPSIFLNTFALSALTTEAAREAIVNPISVFNSRYRDSITNVTIEDSLIEALLKDTNTSRGSFTAAPFKAPLIKVGSNPSSIEAPYLQLALERLWNTATPSSNHLSQRDYDMLGGASGIVRNHLANQLDRLPLQERVLTAAIFHQLVTAGGSKVAHSAADLVDLIADNSAFSARPSINKVTTLLERLSGGDARITRRVQVPGSATVRYEIFHDALASPILAWYTKERTEEIQRRDQKKRRARAVQISGYSCVVLTVALILTINKVHSLRQAAKEALVYQQLQLTTARIRLDEQSHELLFEKRAKDEALREIQYQRADELIYAGEKSLQSGDARTTLNLMSLLSTNSSVLTPGQRAIVQQTTVEAKKRPVEIARVATGSNETVQRITYGSNDGTIIGRVETRSQPTSTTIFVLDVARHVIADYAVSSGGKTDFLLSNGVLVHSSVFKDHLLSITASGPDDVAVSVDRYKASQPVPSQVAPGSSGHIYLARFNDVFKVYDQGKVTSSFTVQNATDTFSLSPDGAKALVYTSPRGGGSPSANVVDAIVLYNFKGKGWFKVQNPILSTNSKWRVSTWSRDSAYAVITQNSMSAIVIDATLGSDSVIPAQTVSYAVMSDNHKCLAAGHADGSVDLLFRDTSAGKSIVTYALQSNLISAVRMAAAVTGLAFSPSGKFLAGADSDGTLKIWHLGLAAQKCGAAPEVLASSSVVCPISTEELRGLGLAQSQEKIQAATTSEQRFACGDVAVVNETMPPPAAAQ